jgi:hypothetical protein
LKFAPDVTPGTSGSATTSALASYDQYWASLPRMQRGRIGGNYGVYGVAKAIERCIGIPRDPRLHPLRIAAVLVSSLSIWIGVLPVFFDKGRRWNWRVFFAAFLFMSLLSFYCYKPHDMPSIGLLSLGLWLLLCRRPAAALVVLLLTGMIRESALHLVWFALSLLIIPAFSPGIIWVIVYFIAFMVQWAVIRHFFPVPSPLRLHHMWGDLTSPTLWASLAMLFWFTAQAAIQLACQAKAALRCREWTFYAIQILMVIPWLMFYKCMNGNWSEFRMLMPIALPLIYCIAHRLSPAQQDQPPV